MGFFDNINFDPSPGSIALIGAGANMLNASTNQRQPIGWGNVVGAGFNGALPGVEYMVASKQAQLQAQDEMNNRLAMINAKHVYDLADDKQKQYGQYQVLSGLAKKKPELLEKIPGFAELVSNDAMSIHPAAYGEQAKQITEQIFKSPQMIAQNNIDGVPGLTDTSTGINTPITSANSNPIPTQATGIVNQIINPNKGKIPSPSNVEPLPGWNTSNNQFTNYNRLPNETPKAYEARLNEEAKIREQQRNLDDKTKIEEQTRNNKQLEEDRQLLANDESKKAILDKTALNLTDIHNNLIGYKSDLDKNWFPSLYNNNVGIDIQQTLGTNDHLSKLKQNNFEVLQNTIKEMKDAGISPTQMMNTETEAKRIMDAKTGDGSINARIEAYNKMSRALKTGLLEHEEKRKAATERLGVEYKPLLDVNILPGNKVYSFNTSNAKIGSTAKVDGKTLRVIGQNLVEEVQ